MPSTLWQYGPAGPETDAIRHDLIALNRLGLVTVDSQPGLLTARSAQRAYVEALLHNDRANDLFHRLAYSDLVTAVVGPYDEGLDEFMNGMVSWSTIVVTIKDGRPHTFLGRCDLIGYIETIDNGNADLGEDLHEVACVQIFDPIWGRNRLFGRLVDALRD